MKTLPDLLSDTPVLTENGDPTYDPPNNSVWIVAVDFKGNVSVLAAPNLHPGFFDNGGSAEELGLPFECDGTTPGVYRWTCSFHELRDIESGIIDDCVFEVEKEEVLWHYANPKPDLNTPASA